MNRIIQAHPERFRRMIPPWLPLRKLKFLLFLGGVIAGCGGDEGLESAFETQPSMFIVEPGDPEPPPPPAFEISILQPTAGARIRQGEPLHMEFLVTMRKPGALPPNLQAEIHQGGLGPNDPVPSGGYATPRRDEGNGRYRFMFDMNGEENNLQPDHYFLKAYAYRTVLSRVDRGSDVGAVAKVIPLQPVETSEFEIIER